MTVGVRCTTLEIEHCSHCSAPRRWPTASSRSCTGERFTDGDKQFIESLGFFFLATARTREGRPDCSFKGGAPGFARVVGPELLVFPDYDGNGMFKSLGNIQPDAAGRAPVHRHAGVSQAPAGQRHGRARVRRPASCRNKFEGAQALIRVTPQHIFPNCPRYIPDLRRDAPSVYVPEAGRTPVEPTWKGSADVRETSYRRANRPLNAERVGLAWGPSSVKPPRSGVCRIETTSSRT